MRKMILTDDFGGIGACLTPAEVDRVADALIAARPDLLVVDAAAGDNCCYPGGIGYLGAAPTDQRMFREGHDLLELAFRRVRAAGVPALAGFRMNDHHGDEPTYTPWQRAHVDWSLGKDTRQTNCYLAVGELRQMDYAVAEVRAHHLAILEEVLGRQQAILRFKTLNAKAAGLTVALNDVALGAPRHVTTPDAERPHLLLWEFAVGTPPLRRGDNAIKFASRHARDGAMEIGELDILVPVVEERRDGAR